MDMVFLVLDIHYLNDVVSNTKEKNIYFLRKFLFTCPRENSCVEHRFGHGILNSEQTFK